ncbi:MAG TPA: hypothetical protein VFR15_04960 [Chloroflexia bacterium]|nr:hypothetical protein [Chloroflexia bacterium]
MKLNPYVYGVLVLVIFFGTIWGAQASGYWSVSGKVDGQGNKVAPTGANAEEIKGWMTLEQVVTAYDVPLADIIAEFKLPADTPASTPLKELESDDFSVTLLRTWLAERSGP